MALTALVFELSFVVVALGLRTLVQRRGTGESGWRVGRPHGAAEAVARAAMVLAGVGLAAGTLQGWGDGGPARPWHWVWAIAGVVLATGSVAVVVTAQLQMGASWRIGLDPDERTELIRSGLYQWSRNPIYAGMVGFCAGVALMLAEPLSAAALVLMLAGTELQVRGVEEPHLRRMHATDFDRWATTVGRFVPGIGVSC